jgi:hypothetical protein
VAPSLLLLLDELLLGKELLLLLLMLLLLELLQDKLRPAPDKPLSLESVNDDADLIAAAGDIGPSAAAGAACFRGSRAACADASAATWSSARRTKKTSSKGAFSASSFNAASEAPSAR